MSESEKQEFIKNPFVIPHERALMLANGAKLYKKSNPETKQKEEKMLSPNKYKTSTSKNGGVQGEPDKDIYPSTLSDAELEAQIRELQRMGA